jgi:hypothetical protein
MPHLIASPSQMLDLHAHFKHLVASCASLHSNPQTLAPHFRHLICPQYPQLSQNCRCGGPPAGGGAAWLAAYESGGAARRASSAAGSSGGGIDRSIESSASSADAFSSRDGVCAIAESPGVASPGVAGTEANVLCRLNACAAPLLACATLPLAVVAACPICASSSSSQCLICLWYCIILLVFCVFGTLNFPGIVIACFGSLSLSNSAIRRAIAVCWRAERSFSLRWPLGAAAARFLFLGLMATLEGS